MRYMLFRQDLINTLESKIQLFHLGDFIDVGMGEHVFRRFKPAERKQAIAFQKALVEELAEAIDPVLAPATAPLNRRCKSKKRRKS